MARVLIQLKSLRPRGPAIACGLAVGLGTLALGAQHTRDQGAPAGPARGKAAQATDHAPERAVGRNVGSRLREGTELRDVTGTFIPREDHYEFVSSDGTHRLKMLENLALERVARKLNDGSQGPSLAWKVSGVVTEFEGANYFLVKRIVAETVDNAQ